MAALASSPTIRRKAEPDPKLAAPTPSLGKSPSRVSAAAQIHRSLKAWRDEAPAAAEPSAEKAPDEEKLDEGGDKSQAKGGEEGAEKSAASSPAMDPSADKAGGDTAEAGAGADAGKSVDSASSEAKAEPTEGAKDEEATGTVAAKLNRKIHRADNKDAAAAKEKRDKLTVLRELIKKEFELAHVEADKKKGEVDTLISIGQDTLNILTMGLAAPVQAAITGGVAAVRGAVDLGIAVQRDALRQSMNHAIDNMTEAQLEALATQVSGKEQTLQQQSEVLRNALAKATTDVDNGEKQAQMGGAGAMALGAGLKAGGAGMAGWSAAKAFLGKASAVVPALGTLVSVGKLAWNMRKAGKLEHEIADLRKELAAMGQAA